MLKALKKSQEIVSNRSHLQSMLINTDINDKSIVLDKLRKKNS